MVLALLPSWGAAGPPRRPSRPPTVPKSSPPSKAPSPQTQHEPTKAPQPASSLDRWSHPPKPPAGPKPPLADAEAAQWRYERYRHDQYTAGKAPAEVLDFERWKSAYFDPVVKGGRPGRPGGPAQVATRQLLAAEEGYINSETRKLGDKVVDMYKPNALGGTDYVEVDGLLQNGLPKAAMRDKLKAELRALGQDDTLLIVDKQDPSRRILYRSGERPEIVDTRLAGGE